MKKLLKNIGGILVLAAIGILFARCEQDPQLKKYVYPMPEVTGMTPNIGYVTSQVVITGTNFGNEAKAVKSSSEAYRQQTLRCVRTTASQ